jgi:ferredoxin/flavodoxin---NADP+ reductase
MGLENFHVAVIGAGPAGLFGAQQLAKLGVHVVLFNRDIKPGGLAEYGIYPAKHKMKQGLRGQFEKILVLDQIDYLGNVTIENDGDLSLHALMELGFDAVLVTIGAQATKWLGLPGEALHGVYHAKDLVYHYNKLPPFSTGQYEIGKNVVVVGVGNVMMDMAHWLIRDLKVDTMTAIARRGPAEVKFDKKEFETVGANVDLNALDAEIARVAPIMRAVGQDPEQARNDLLAGLDRALPPVSSTRFLFQFLASTQEICGDSANRVLGLEVEDTTLLLAEGEIRANGLGTFREIPCDTVIFAIGDSVDTQFGLPVTGGEFAKSPAPRFPIEGVSYEAYDPQTQQPVQGIFLAGWARQASTGLVGNARKDGTNGALAVAQYLNTLRQPRGFDTSALLKKLEARGDQFITKTDLEKLAEAERAEANLRQLPEHKFHTNEEMINNIRR